VYDANYTVLNEDGTKTSTRFLDANKLIMYAPQDLGSTLTCPHPHADYSTGFYGWEEDKTDPYGHEVGVGITCFPLIRHPELLLNSTLYS